jgi:ABC-type glycerol-3-phosphate transport system substrate-binding protein
MRVLSRSVARVLLLASSLTAVSAVGARAEQSLNLCYMNHPVIAANVAILEKWAKEQGVTLNKTPVSYSVYLPKITQMLSAGATDQCDIIWNNDDWGQDLEGYLASVEDVTEVRNVAEGQLEPFHNKEGQATAVPIVTTAGIFFYRTDLVPEDQVPKTWDELVAVSKKLQEEDRVRWGYVGGMSYTNTFFSFWWTLWNNNCDIYEPLYERDNVKMGEAGWKPMTASACQKETAEFWWDALHTNKISPPGMTTYSRDEANAIFQAGDAAFTVADTTFLGNFNNPDKSKIAGKVGIASFPQGPNSSGHRNWIDIWGWSIPKVIDAEKQAAAKKLLGAMMTDVDGQIEQWHLTGGPPPNTKVWKVLDEQDPNWVKMSKILFDSKHVHDAYYFRNWAATHKVYSDVMIRAMKGSREDIQATLEAGVQPIHDGAPK